MASLNSANSPSHQKKQKQNNLSLWGAVARRRIHERRVSKATASRISAASGPDGNMLKKVGDLHSHDDATPSSQHLRLFVGTWNVGGRPPTAETRESVHEWLIGSHELQQLPDIYVIGFQEIVPLNAKNVLGVSKEGERSRSNMWEALICEALNKTSSIDGHYYNNIQHNLQVNQLCADLVKMQTLDMPTTKISESSQVRNNNTEKEGVAHAHSCMSKATFYPPAKDNMISTLTHVVTTNTQQKGDEYKGNHSLDESRNKQNARLNFLACETQPPAHEDHNHNASSLPHDDNFYGWTPLSRVRSSKFRFQEFLEIPDGYRYTRIARKQMVGLYITIWTRSNLRHHIKDVRMASVGCGIMNHLGNKGSVSISLSMHQTTFCFICSHLRSGETADDVVRRNGDIKNILHRTRFPRLKNRSPNFSLQPPETVLAHDRIILLGDLNYRLSIAPTRLQALILQQDWNTLFENDELKATKVVGGVLEGWREGSIHFAPTYKYIMGSDTYYWMEKEKVFSKRRAPAWCDRILWHGKGLKQLCYTRCKSKHSDHRPVRSIFMVEVEDLEKNSLLNDTNQRISPFMGEVKELICRRKPVKRFSLR